MKAGQTEFEEGSVMSINQFTKTHLVDHTSRLCVSNLCVALEGHKEQKEVMADMQKTQSEDMILMKRMIIRKSLDDAKKKISQYPYISKCVALDIYKKEHNINEFHEIDIKEFKHWYSNSFSSQKHLCSHLCGK